ncbi:MAG: PKD-like family lipoprotein [Candidatus Pedobacter colombiensis]|uniref:PKD-like family lipoprotein n=1 Tax=Candidatus Pedobacter colombiensis TaxID=3121371 RepID=A0AAJ5W8G7_9SPHI|nr:PKD-like family lipoprotein [Pedobacter sp.]WEK18989.1 MAG: PKD-like family lipoprotein [Pedobacter sp.]
MKLIKYIFVLCLVSTALISCRKDLGNYEYHEINDLKVSGIEEEYIITAGQNLNLKPVLDFSKDPSFSANNYTFEWISFNLAAILTEQRKSLYKNQNFDIPFPLGIGSYTLFYVVTEKSTGISWNKSFKVKVNGIYKGGWGVLSEVNSQSRLDYFEYDHATGTYPKEYRDFTSLFSDASTGKGLTLPGKPKYLAGWSNRTAATGTAFKYFLYVGTDKITEKLNLTDGFIWKEDYAFRFESAGSSALNTVDYIKPVGSGSAYSYLNGDVFYRYDSFQYLFGTPINKLTNSSYFQVSSHTAVSRYSTVNTVILMYDITNKRFVRNVNSALTSVTPLAYTAGTSAFDPNNVGMDLVWMDQTLAYGGRAYAVLKDANSKYYLARMNNAAAFLAYAWDDISSLPEINKATCFAVDQQYGYLFYSVDGKLYQYDVDSKQTKLMKDLGTERITVLKYNLGNAVSLTIATNPTYATTYGKRFISVITDLIVGTYDPSNPNSSGKVKIYQVPQFNADLITEFEFGGFGKVADVAAAETPLGW